MARIVRLQTQQERACRATARWIADQLHGMPDEVRQFLSGDERLALSRASRALDRVARPPDEKLWPGGYAMLSQQQVAAVWDAICDLKGKDRPVLVRDAFMQILLNLEPGTGEVLLSRKALAAKLGVAPRHLSTAMSTLERLGVIYREWLDPSDMGSGGRRVTYKVNANVAWNGSLDVRKREAARVKPPSEVIELRPRAAARRPAGRAKPEPVAKAKAKPALKVVRGGRKARSRDG